MEYEQDLKDYIKAMPTSDVEMCLAIEQKYYLLGYDPDVILMVDAEYETF